MTLPEMTASDKKAAITIISRIVSAAYIAAPNLMSLLTFKRFILSVKYGNNLSSPIVYGMYGFILCGVLGDIDSGYRFGNLALRMLKELKTRNVEARTVFVVNFFIRHWREHPRQTLQPLLDGYSIGMETLELEYAGYCAMTYCYYSYSIGQELVLLERDLAKYSQVFQKLKQEQTLRLINQTWQTVLNLMGEAEKPCYLIGKAYDESQTLQLEKKVNDPTLFFTYIFTNLCYLTYLNKNKNP